MRTQDRYLSSLAPYQLATTFPKKVLFSQGSRGFEYEQWRIFCIIKYLYAQCKVLVHFNPEGFCKTSKELLMLNKLFEVKIFFVIRNCSDRANFPKPFIFS